MDLEHGGEEPVLAVEVRVERAFRQAGLGSDGVDADPREAPAIEELIGGVDDAPPGRLCRPAHRALPRRYTDQ